LFDENVKPKKCLRECVIMGLDGSRWWLPSSIRLSLFVGDPVIVGWEVRWLGN